MQQANSIQIGGGNAILIVDDDRVFHDIFSLVFEMNGIPNQKIFFTSGDDCLEYISSLQPEEHPELILMDINMPGLSGIETVRAIRQMKRFEVKPTISMLSSSVDPEDIKQSMEAGANSYMEKKESIMEFQFEVNN